MCCYSIQGKVLWSEDRDAPGAATPCSPTPEPLPDSSAVATPADFVGGRDTRRRPTMSNRDAIQSEALGRRILAEFLGTGLLVAAVVGSGIAAARLSPGNIGLELLENTAATVGTLVALILAFGPLSGAHFNPVVTLAHRVYGMISTRDTGAYIGAQIAGGLCGSVLANAMFALPIVEVSTKVRSSGPLWLAEVAATFGLLLVIFGVVRSGRSSAVPFAVGAYIGGAYFFTSSTSFANPAVTIGRTLSDTFAGIRPTSAPMFIAMQLIGGALAVAAIRILYPHLADSAGNVVVPHQP
jgi:glycerol uptake facilitator-like aquaporin